MGQTITLPNGMEIPVPPAHAERRQGVGRPSLGEGKFVQTTERPVKALRWTHELAIDLILENPEWSQGDLARHFGYSDAWVSRVISSDAFQSKLAERRDEIINPEIKASIEERFRHLAEQSIARLHQKLENPNASDNLVLRSVEIAAKALGLGARQAAPAMSMQIAIVVPPKADPGGMGPAVGQQPAVGPRPAISASEGR